MARRKQNNELFELLSVLPWWISAALGVAGFIYMRFIAPNADFESVAGQIFSQMASSLALVWLVFCLAAAAMGALGRLKSGTLYKKAGSGESIGDIGWMDFEILVSEMYRRMGFDVIGNFKAGADGGVDLTAKKDDQTILVQCKHWQARKVGVPVVREMFGLLTSERVSAVHIITSGWFTDAAKAFAMGKPIALIDGEKLKQVAEKHQAQKAKRVSESARIEQTLDLPSSKTDKERSDNCPKCGSTLLLRVAKKGTHKGKRFMGCAGFPKCRYVRSVEI